MLMRRLRRCERGMALPLAIGTLAVLSIMGTTIYTFTSATARSASSSNFQLEARQYAEAGLAHALSVLNYWNEDTQQNNPADPTLLGCNAGGTSCTPRVLTFAHGTAEWTGVLDQAANPQVWTITSTGFARNPAGTGQLSKRLTATVPLTTATGAPNAAVWNYVYASRPPGSGCEVDVNGSNVVFDVPLYVAGDLCLSGSNVTVDERGEGQTPPPQAIDLRVAGKLVFSGSNASIGVSGDNITSAAVAGGCTHSVDVAGSTCNAAYRTPSDPSKQRWYVDTTNAFEAVEVPEADFASHFSVAKPGPAADCVNATNPNSLLGSVFDPDVTPTMDGDAASFNLTGTSYQCRVNDAGGNRLGEISYNSTTRVLTVHGTIFFDGPITTTASNATYQGSGTIYANGAFTMSGSNATLCANPSCTFTNWNPNSEMLIVVSNVASGNAIVFGGSNNSFQGGLFCNPNATAAFTGSNNVIHGPVICGRFTFGSNTEFKPLPQITNLPLGAPVENNVHVAPGTPTFSE
jgi:hypothetical protein